MSQHTLALATPAITGYHHRAMPLSILGLHDACQPWIFEHFIQMRCQTQIDDKHNVFDFADPNLLTTPTPWLSIQCIERSLIQRYLSDFRLFVIDCLLQEYYVHLYVDEYFIPQRAPFQTEHIIHDILVTGFDDESAVFTVAGFDEQGRYISSLVTYQQFQAATARASVQPDHDDPVRLLQMRPVAAYHFSIAHVIQQLTEYYTSTAPSALLFQSSAPAVYGLQTYEALQQYINSGIQQQVELEARPFQLLFEQKHLMLHRLTYLQDRGYLHSSDELILAYTELKTMAQTVRNGLIKYQLTQHSPRLLKVIDQLAIMHDKEQRAVKTFVETVQTC
ncbi:hypothetical protein [Tengunoibacter tsumagoiensis]|uniref:Butirosin biosynthesis protein H N-terminal domain-containing protein n=1 Tax=Tengunoibacter tsumagoiensis TaxID=2014871 RepID=A0A402A9E1_9CHLR|nr:hypothetical protein [Tengunoibacter tsumagoiensis]GCE15718.1 hypothetical protein KTT_55770 [Tengunoibacter tsumagoiensis]